MTEENNVLDVVEKPIPRGGSSYFFDFINNKLANIQEAIQRNNDEYARKAKVINSANADRSKDIVEAKGNIRSLIANRIDMRKANISRNITDAKVRILDVKEKIARLKATVKAVVSYDSNKGVLERIDSAQRGVADKYGKKRDSLIGGKVDEVKRRDGSIRKEVRNIAKDRVNSFLAGAKREWLRCKRISKRVDLGFQTAGSVYMGVLTSPAKMAKDGAEWVGKKVKQGYDYVTDPARMAAAAVRAGEVVRKAKREVRKARILANKEAFHFMRSVNKKWKGGVDFAKSVVRSVKEAPGKAWASMKGCYEETAKKARESYNNSTVGKVVSAVRTGYKAGLQAYANAIDR